jgi:hypothetical protein
VTPATNPDHMHRLTGDAEASKGAELGEGVMAAPGSLAEKGARGGEDILQGCDVNVASGSVATFGSVGLSARISLATQELPRHLAENFVVRGT